MKTLAHHFQRYCPRRCALVLRRATHAASPHSIQKVTRVAHGVGFVVAYDPKQVWIASTIPSVCPDSRWGTRNKFKRLPLPEGTTVRELSAGREHLFVLTAKGEGTTFVFISHLRIHTPPPPPPQKRCPLVQTCMASVATHRLLRKHQWKCTW